MKGKDYEGKNHPSIHSLSYTHTHNTNNINMHHHHPKRVFTSFFFLPFYLEQSSLKEESIQNHHPSHVMMMLQLCMNGPIHGNIENQQHIMNDDVTGNSSSHFYFYKAGSIFLHTNSFMVGCNNHYSYKEGMVYTYLAINFLIPFGTHRKKYITGTLQRCTICHLCSS